jgi:hypothetical protein
VWEEMAEDGLRDVRGLLSEELLRRMDLLRSDEIERIINQGAKTLRRRSEPEKNDFNDRLGKALNSQIYNVFVYVLKHNPTKRELNRVFPETTVDRATYELELSKVIEERNDRYYVLF